MLRNLSCFSGAAVLFASIAYVGASAGDGSVQRTKPVQKQEEPYPEPHCLALIGPAPIFGTHTGNG